MPEISAIICTHNRLPFLKKCLAALLGQTLDREAFEIVVVDNCSSDGTAEYLHDLAKTQAHLKYVHESKLGVTSARNAGSRAAVANYLAYTDDDAEPYPDWLERLLAIFRTVRPQPAVAGGEIEAVWEAPKPPWADVPRQRLLSAYLGWSDSPKFVRHPEAFICEVNCAYRRDILERYGPWPEDLGRIGSLLLSSDIAINFDISDIEKTLYFDPHLKVRHHIHAERLNVQWMARRCFWQGVSRAILEKKFGRAAPAGWDKRAEHAYGRSLREPTFLSPAASIAEIHAGFDEQFLLGWHLQKHGIVMQMPSRRHRLT